MPLTLSVATPDDLPSLVRAQYAAFHPTDTLHVLIYPSPDPIPESVFEKTVQRQRAAWKDNVTWVKVTDDETGAVIAVKEMWMEDEVVASGEAAKNAGKGVDDLEYVSFIMGEFMGRRRDRVQGPTVVLDICFTHSGWQGKGAGKLLVKWGTEKADELGLKCFVEASYLGRPLYEKFGFVIGEHVLLNGGKVREEWKEFGEIGYYWMERELRAGEGSE
jgi:GNAT superfamily N-acetyltransferase